MRVGLVLEQCLAPVPGGTGRYSREIAAALARRAPAGSHVSSTTAWHRSVSGAVVPGVDGPHRLPLGRRPLYAAWERGVGPGVRAELVHAPTPLAPPRRGRLVVTVHDAVPWTHPETLTPRGVRWHRVAVERAAGTADLLVVPTQAVATELARHVPLREVLVVGHGVSADLGVPADADTRAVRMDLPEQYLLTVATLEPRKGLSVLLSALTDPGAPDVPLLVVGQPGWGGLDLQAEASRLGLRDVRLLGRVPDADLAVLLDRATAAVVPSRAEGFGLPVLEAMAAGTAVVISPDPALVEVGAHAVLVAPDQELPAALRRVVEDEALRAQLASAGRARAAAFTWDAAADALWSAYAAIS
ncbi:MAG: glycosyltransferase family 4 protein [Actinobacteria bacterium]|nr:glycosyltransferase family 4 protein [Actinomycetota bacterium]MCA1722206.1 glycosyltransferase family 4 protein [Actinomycetota bacterium]